MANQPPDDDVTGNTTGDATDAASFIRRHAGEHASDLTSEQRDLLGRVIARRLARGVKIDLIARAVAHALPELDTARAQRLGRDETLRARAWEDRARLRADGVTAIAISAARDACPACRAAADSRRSVESASLPPAIPIAGCTHPSGCRCRYVAASEASAVAHPEEDAAASGSSLVAANGAGDGAGDETEEQPTRPWYRPHPPRPHGPRWTEEERAARHRARRPPTRKPARKRPPR